MGNINLALIEPRLDIKVLLLQEVLIVTILDINRIETPKRILAINVLIETILGAMTI